MSTEFRYNHLSSKSLEEQKRIHEAHIHALKRKAIAAHYQGLRVIADRWAARIRAELGIK